MAQFVAACKYLCGVCSKETAISGLTVPDLTPNTEYTVAVKCFSEARPGAHGSLRMIRWHG